MTYNDSNHLVTSKKEAFDFLDFRFLIFFKIVLFYLFVTLSSFFRQTGFPFGMFLGKGLLLGSVPKQGMFPGDDRRLYGAPPLQHLKRRGRPASAHCQVCLKTRNSNSKRTVQSSSTHESSPSDLDHILTPETQGLHTLYI